MTSAITGAREGLEASLTAQGLRVQDPAGQVSPPAVFLVPGDPWLAPTRLGPQVREVTYRVIGLVGLGVDTVQQSESELMAQRLADAIAATQGPAWALISLDPPAEYDVGGVTYLAIVGSTHTHLAGGS